MPNLVITRALNGWIVNEEVPPHPGVLDLSKTRVAETPEDLSDLVLTWAKVGEAEAE